MHSLQNETDFSPEKKPNHFPKPTQTKPTTDPKHDISEKNGRTSAVHQKPGILLPLRSQIVIFPGHFLRLLAERKHFSRWRSRLVLCVLFSALFFVRSVEKYLGRASTFSRVPEIHVYVTLSDDVTRESRDFFSTMRKMLFFFFSR